MACRCALELAVSRRTELIMADNGRKITDIIQARMERDIIREYREAYGAIQDKIGEHLSKFEVEDLLQAERLRQGEITKKQYQDWRIRNIGMGKRWEELRDNIAHDLHRANQMAMEIAKGYVPEVFAKNFLYGTDEIRRQGVMSPAFSLVNRDTVDNLIRENPKLLPDPTPGGPTARMLAENKDLRWNRQKLQSAIIQGCLQGEGTKQIVDRFQAVTDMNRKAAMRNARTALTGAAGSGRHSANERAKRLGVDLVEEWAATLDAHTRDSHAEMDGERKEVDEPTFSNGCRFPGDPYGHPSETYNCRCDLISWVRGYEPEYGVNEYMGNNDAENDWSETVPRVVGAEEKALLREHAREKGIMLNDIRAFDGDADLLKSGIDAIAEQMKQLPVNRRVTLNVRELPDGDFGVTNKRTITISNKVLRDRVVTERNINRVPGEFGSTRLEDIFVHEYAHIYQNVHGINAVESVKEAYYNVYGETIRGWALREFINNNVSQYAYNAGKTEYISEIAARNNSYGDAFTREFIRIIGGR